MPDTNTGSRDERFMHRALELARQAFLHNEVPVGAVIVKDERIIGEGYNLVETLRDGTAHAEIRAIQAALRSTGHSRLIGCELYVTMEPCIMCAGALWQTRIFRVCYGCSDSKGGAYGTLYAIHSDKRLNHQVIIQSGLLEEASRGLIQDFFRQKRSSERCQSG